jgi:hypothetical protein
MSHLPPRAIQGADAALQHPPQQAPQGAHYPPQHVPPPQPQYQQQHSNATLPEQGPVLPALNGINNPNSSSPRPNDQRPTDSLSVPDANGSSQVNAPSPGRTIPNIHTLLNSQADPGTAANPSNNAPSNQNPSNTLNTSNASDGIKPVSRSGSRSPANGTGNGNPSTNGGSGTSETGSGSQRPPSEITTGPDSHAADRGALSKLKPFQQF